MGSAGWSKVVQILTLAANWQGPISLPPYQPLSPAFAAGRGHPEKVRDILTAAVSS